MQRPQGEYVGLDQINVRLPRTLVGRGEVDIEVITEGPQGEHAAYWRPLMGRRGESAST